MGQVLGEVGARPQDVNGVSSIHSGEYAVVSVAMRSGQSEQSPCFRLGSGEKADRISESMGSVVLVEKGHVHLFASIVRERQARARLEAASRTTARTARVARTRARSNGGWRVVARCSC